jgi:DNA repair photolyase
MRYIGVTETGDPGHDFSWVDRAQDANIIITKNPGYRFIQEIMKENLYRKCIVHITCTGWGGTKLEPNVQPPEWVCQQTQALLDAGFPLEQLVLRVDPIIPTTYGLWYAYKVIELFMTTIKPPRIRVSIIDMYSHTLRRWQEMLSHMVGKDLEVYQIPYYTFYPDEDSIIKVSQILNHAYQQWQPNFEACAEPLLVKHSNGQVKSIGCVSQEDINILGVDLNLEYGKKQRSTCLCPANKKQLLGGYHGRCPNKCIYCYIKDND